MWYHLGACSQGYGLRTVFRVMFGKRGLKKHEHRVHHQQTKLFAQSAKQGASGTGANGSQMNRGWRKAGRTGGVIKFGERLTKPGAVQGSLCQILSLLSPQ